MPLRVATIDTPSLGDRSYVASAGNVAVVVDPQRDLDRLEPHLDGKDVALVVETHIHNDYVTGGLALARRTGADYCVAAADEVEFARRPVADGDAIDLGHLRVEVIATPGHTPTHLAYRITAGADDPGALFTGGSLLYGNVGRTDLISQELTRQLTAHQYRSARKLLDLPPQTGVYPTHGFGSFCASSAPTEDGGEHPAVPADTIAAERLGNIVMRFDDEQAFVAHLVAGLGAYPRYYAHMGPRNRQGPDAADLQPAPDAGDLARRIAAGEWVVDLRDRRAYAAGHTPGTLGIELGDSFATYLGWLIPWGTPVTLLGDPDDVAEAQRMLTRIGIDRPAGQARPAGDGGGYPVVRWEELAAADGAAVLDVRRDEEYEEAHVAGALHVPIHEVPDRHGELPGGEQLWVHCRSGYRASIACSLLHREGHDVVLIDDDWDRIGEAAIPIEA